MIKMMMGDKQVADVFKGYAGFGELDRHPATGIEQQEGVCDANRQTGALPMGVRFRPPGSE